ncbi:GerMN domain-containing protein [Thermoflavimicrobium dichotomicum]|uniref:Germination protein M n=1 Tax=Thermoflavimicrobium dichotomicum TaxID=46223 RepID=A0A1I3RB59_9BACL|nr:GerMN domain-containing protein [Thermoflavimicrobium dichotomicum]SFJ43032.1 germination protein M [Thermoflavimicrobium dichotomicum]
MFDKKRRLAAVTLLFPLMLTGCLFGPDSKSSQEIDPPPEHVQKEHAHLVNTKPQNESQALKEKRKNGTELYLLTETGYVVPYTIPVAKKEMDAKKVLSYLVEGGPVQSHLPQGFSAVLPKGTKVKGLHVQAGVANVDFSREFLNYDKKLEKKILDAVTWTLTDFDDIKAVNIWVDGKPLEAMPQGHTPAQHLTRENGINVEVTEGVNINQSMPVTIYFLGQNQENMVYFVPVTRMVHRQENVAEATLKELIKGPKQNSSLFGVIDANTEVNQVSTKGDMVTADFGEQLLQYNSTKTASKDALQSIVLSLTENNSVSKVKITVNGKNTVGVFGQKGENIDAPISRPQMINPSEL